MAKMKVGKAGFSLIPEGVHVFKVVSCEDKYEEFDKVSYELQTSSGQKVTNRFNFVNDKGEVNDIGVFYWSKFARACLNLRVDEEPEIDFSDLVGCYVEAEVKHNTYIAKSGDHKGEELTGANLVDKTYAPTKGFGSKKDNDGFENIPDELDDLDDFLDE